MKTIKLTTLLLASLLIMNGCAKDMDDEQIYGFDGFWYSPALLRLSFEDASGNNLVEGLGSQGGYVLPHLYTLELIFPDERMNPANLPPRADPFAGFRHQPLYCAVTGERGQWEPPPVAYRQRLQTRKCWFYGEAIVTTNFASLRHWPDTDEWIPMPPPDKIIVLLTCAHIFGDDVAREIVTYWKWDVSSGMRMAYRVEFEGKEFVLQPIYITTPDTIAGHKVTIVLGGD